MKKGVIALLGLVLALQVGIGCGVGQAAAVFEVPCCGANCPFPSAAGDAACCPSQTPGAPAQAVSATTSHPSLKPVVRSIQIWVVRPALTGVEGASFSENGPPGAIKLALLCSRQI